MKHFKSFTCLFLVLVLALVASCADPMENLFKDSMNKVVDSVEQIKGTDGVVDAEIISAGPLKAAQVLGTPTIRLEWTANAKAETFVVYRAEAKAIQGTLSRIVGYEYDDKAKFVEVARLDNKNKKVASWTDNSVTTGVGYSYTIKALRTFKDILFESPNSPIVITSLLWAPQDVRASFKDSSDYIRVSWSPIVGVSQYDIYRCAGEYTEQPDPSDPEGLKTIKVAPTEPALTEYKKVQESALVTPYFTDLSVEQDSIKDKAFFYRVVAYINGNPTELKDSSVGVGEYLPPGAVPPPVNVVATQGFTSGITVTWDARGGVSDYVVYRSEGKTIAEASLDKTLKAIGKTKETKFIDSKEKLDINTHYWYAVSCINGNGDEGNYSKDFTNAEGAYLNEGFLLTKPTIKSQYFPKVGSDTEAMILLSWKPVPGADGYLISTDAGTTFPEEASNAVTDNNYLIPNGTIDTQFAVKAVKMNGDVMEKSDSSNVPENREFVVVGSTCLSDGSVKFEWPKLVTSLFEPTISKVERQPLFQKGYQELSVTIDTTQPFVDHEHTPDFDYVTLGKNILGLQAKEGETHNECLKSFFSDKYRFTLSKEGVEYVINGEGVRMFSPDECYFIVKVADHTGTNKTTNKITEVFETKQYGGSLVGNWFPKQAETDQGYYGGSLVFDPYKSPSVQQQWAEIVFEFKKMEDYPGMIIDGTNYIWKNSDSGKINNPSGTVRAQNPTLNVTLFGEIRIWVEERTNIDRVTSAVLGGNSHLTVKNILTNEEIIPKHTFNETTLKGFFADNGPIATAKLIPNCPGGRNYTRVSDGAKAAGHYGRPGEPWLDPENCGPAAKLQHRDQAEKMIDTDIR